MWKLLSTIKDFWERHFSEMDFVEDGLPADNLVTYEFVKWREESSPSCIPRFTMQPARCISQRLLLFGLRLLTAV
jgi:hypothetical protein